MEPYHYGQYPAQEQAPPLPKPPSGAVTTFGMLNILFGVLGFCCACRSLGGGVGMVGAEGTILLSILYIVVGIALMACAPLFIAGGIGLLNRKHWGRKLSVVTGIIFVVASGCEFLVDVLAIPYATEQTRDLLADMPDWYPSDLTEGQVTLSTLFVTLCCMVPIRIGYPILMIYFLGRPEVLDSLEE